MTCSDSFWPISQLFFMFQLSLLSTIFRYFCISFLFCLVFVSFWTVSISVELSLRVWGHWESCNCPHCPLLLQQAQHPRVRFGAMVNLILLTSATWCKSIMWLCCGHTIDTVFFFFLDTAVFHSVACFSFCSSSDVKWRQLIILQFTMCFNMTQTRRLKMKPLLWCTWALGAKVCCVILTCLSRPPLC